jgi:DNA-binding MarR family transcriptional regulator
MSQRRVDWTRQTARRLMDKTPPDAEIAYDMVSEAAEEAMGASPSGPDLRGWQSLATDLASALRIHEPELAERARLLASRLRALIGLMARAPVERLAVRPTSRRVLGAILELGGTDCTLAEVRKRTGLSQTHMSNVVRALSAHGFIELASDVKDGRGRRLSVTSLGRTAVGRADARPGDRFDSQLSDEPIRGHAGGLARSYDPGLRADNGLEAAA